MQSSSSPLQISVGGLQRPQVQSFRHNLDPVDPHEVVQEPVLPLQQPKVSSQDPSQSSSTPLQVSAGGTQVPQSQEALQVCVPVVPQLVVQLRVSPWKQFSPLLSVHVPQSPHWQLLPQVLDCVPQFPPPQSLLSVSPSQHWLVPLSAQVLQSSHWQSWPQVLNWVPQFPLPRRSQSRVSLCVSQHWLELLSVQEPHAPQLHVSVQVRVCVPHRPSPISSQSPVFVSTPGFVHTQVEFTHSSQVQSGATHRCWPVHEAISVHPSEVPRTHVNVSSTEPLQSLSTASHSSVELVIVHSHPSLSSPLALPYPKSHAMVHVPPVHTGTEWSLSGHAAPQALQL